MTAQELKPGQWFTWKPRQRKPRKVESTRLLRAADHPNVLQVDSLLVQLPYCRQVVLPLSHPVALHPAP